MKKLMMIILLGLTLLQAHTVKLDFRLIRKDYNILKHLTRTQWEQAIRVYNACYKYDMGYTCVAIAWQESHLGVYLINERTQDYGLMGINIPTYLDNHNLRRNYWYIQKLKTELVRNDDLNIAEAINNLNGWRNQFGNNWIEIWAHYNGGNAHPNYRYAKDILNFIYAFKRYTTSKRIQLLFN